MTQIFKQPEVSMRFAVTIILETVSDTWWGGSTVMDEDKLMIFTVTLRNRKVQDHFLLKDREEKGLLQAAG